MKYWDSSALTAMLLPQRASEQMKGLATEDPAVSTWWGTRIECASALAKAQREGVITLEGFGDALERLRRAAATWTETEPSESVREQAIRLVRVHNLRAGDAIQLAAAFVVSDLKPSALDFVTLDTRQAEAADKEGFRVIA